MRATSRLSLPLLSLASLCLAGCGKKVYDRPAFEKAVLGLDAKAVRSLLGAPDKIDPVSSGPAVMTVEQYGRQLSGGGPKTGELWTYEKRTKNPTDGQTDGAVFLLIERDRVTMVRY